MSRWDHLHGAGTLLALGAAVLLLASTFLIWQDVGILGDVVHARGYELAAGLGAGATGLLAGASLILIRDRRTRLASAGACFVVAAFVASERWLLMRDAEPLLEMFGARLLRGPGALVALAGALLGIAGLVWAFATGAPEAARPDDPWD